MKEIKFKFYDQNEKRLVANVDVFDNALYHYLVRKTLVPCQFTGLQDKTGKDIYYGDVLYTIEGNKYKRKGIVEFRNGCFTIKIKGVYRHLSTIAKTYEVIGSIYENPELIK